MKIVSWNVNGLRARLLDGTLQKVLSLDADVYCFQELKLSDLGTFDSALFERYHVSAKLAKKRGYSGVCILSKEPPQFVNKESGFIKADNEGRYLSATFPNGIRVISVYMPHGKRDKSEIQYKLFFANHLQNHLFKDDIETIVCTDFNIAHKEIDLARPKQNNANVMFTPEERKVIDDLISLGFVDAFRVKETGEGYYTWWPFSYNAYERNLGWRIDYFFISKKLRKHLNSVNILKEVRGSDHAPIIMELK